MTKPQPKHEIQKLIDSHTSWFENNERNGWDKARAYYNGNFEVSSLLAGTKHLTSLNLVFSVAETAISSLLGSNPTVGAKPRTKKSIENAPLAADIVNYTFDDVNIRYEAALSLVDSVLLGRAIFKTVWDADNDQADVLAQDPYSVFFDPAARRPRDIRYWLQCVPISIKAFKKRQKEGTYKKSAKVVADRWPTLLLNDKEKDNSLLKKEPEWVTVWEYYDMESKRVTHYIPKTGEVVLEEDIVYNPFSVYFLNHNGKNCYGLSEIQLILPQQDDINAILSQIKLIVLLSVPRILFDAGVIDEAELEAVMDAATGSFVGVRAKGKTATPLAEAFYNCPVPEVPAALPLMLDKQEKTVSIVSALAEAARGQVTGAKTATEMALIDAQLRTRLAAREGNLAACLEEVAAKVLFLSSKYMKKTKLVEVTGDEYKEVGLKDLKDVVVKFKLALYNPLKSNPAVEAERFNALYPDLAADEAFDPRVLREELVRLNGIRQDALLAKEDGGDEPISEEDIKALAMMAAQEQAGEEAAVEAVPGSPENMPLDPNTIQKQALEQAAMAAQGIPPTQQAPV